MCEPMTIAALGAMAVGAGMQYKAGKERQSDMRKLQRRETERVDNLHSEAQQHAVKNRETYERGALEQQMDAASGERQAQYAKADAVAPRANEAVIGSQGGNQVINDAFARAMAGAQADATQSGALRAELASFGDSMSKNAVENNRRTGDIGMIGSFQQGNSRILPLELQHAATRERGKETWGKVLQAFGSAMLGGAGMGAGAAAGGAGAAGAAAGGSAVGAGAGAAAGGIPWGSIFSAAAQSRN